MDDGWRQARTTILQKSKLPCRNYKMTPTEKQTFLNLIDTYLDNLAEQLRDGLSEEFNKAQARLELYLSGMDDSQSMSSSRWLTRQNFEDLQVKIDNMREFRKLIEKMPTQ